MVFLARGGRIPTPVICRVPPGFLGSNFDQVITRGRGGGGESYQSFMRGDSALRSNPWPFYITFLKEKDPFRLPSIDKCYPFHQTKFEPLLTAVYCKCTVFKTWTNHKTRKLYGLFYIHKMHVSALLGIFENRNDRFPYPLIRRFN